jgi:DNA-directed RNA polymerase subunit alpha
MEPLPRGYGHTLGHSLRRTLQSSVPGIAVTSVRMARIAHEFAPLPGVAESVTEIILNLKELAVQGPSDNGQEWRAHVSASGPGEVTAGDIELPRGLRIVNPEHHLATLTTDDARLEMNLRLATGLGYVPAERHDVTRWEEGMIPVDSIFSPVRRVVHQVEATRVGHDTNFDRLVLEIWTNGAWFPEEALRHAARALIQSVQTFIEGEFEPLDLTPLETTPLGDKVLHPLQDIPIEELDFSRRTYNCLKKEQIDTLAQLAGKSLEDLEHIRGFGDRSMQEVIVKLQERGLTLRGYVPK